VHELSDFGLNLLPSPQAQRLLKGEAMSSSCVSLVLLMSVVVGFGCSSPAPSDDVPVPSAVLGQGGPPEQVGANEAEVAPADEAPARTVAKSPEPSGDGGAGPVGELDEAEEPNEAAPSVAIEVPEAPVDVSDAGGAGGAAASDAAENAGGAGAAGEPSCAGLSDGDYCGPELTAPGERNTSYLCSGGLVASATACPGKCSDGSCALNSTSSGASVNPTERFPCDMCSEEFCAAEATGCRTESACDDLNRCRVACTSASCAAQCDVALSPSPAYDALAQCQSEYCARDCKYL